MSSIGTTPRSQRLAILFLLLTVAVLALELWGIRRSLIALF